MWFLKNGKMSIPLLGRSMWMVLWGDYPFLALMFPCSSSSGRVWWPMCELGWGEKVSAVLGKGRRERRAETLKNNRNKALLDLRRTFHAHMALLYLNNGEGTIIFYFITLSLRCFRTGILERYYLDISSVKWCSYSSLIRTGTQRNIEGSSCITQVFPVFSINQETHTCLRIWRRKIVRKFVFWESLWKVIYLLLSKPAR